MIITKVYAVDDNGRLYVIGDVSEFTIETSPYEAMTVNIRGHSLRAIKETHIDRFTEPSYEEFEQILSSED